MDISEVKNTIYHLTHECYGESEVTDAICALRKLCDYLDTGLTPEEITALKAKKHEYHMSNERLIKSNNRLLHENSKVKSELSDNAIAMTVMCGQKQQAESERDTLKKALAELIQTGKYNFCELCGAQCVDAGLDFVEEMSQCGCFVWHEIQQAQEQEGKK